MTLGRTRAVALHGLAGRMVEVEAHIAPGLPHIAVSGLPDKACGQAPDRIRSAAAISGAPIPSHRIVVNLSPAEIPKQGSGFDLPIAVAILVAARTIRAGVAAEAMHVAELGLDGRLRGVRGVLPMVLAAARAGVRDVVVAPENVAEAQLVDGVRVHAPQTLAELIGWYAACELGAPLPVADVVPSQTPRSAGHGDLADVVGQAQARLSLELAATGGHHLALSGPPGIGKTMLSERLVTILPRLTRDEALESHAIRSLVGLVPEGGGLDRTPPFEAPHHSSTVTAIAGGGSATVVPGAISRAHGGVLFLDEAPEFRPSVLQTLRQPLESGHVTIGRARETVTYPARFLLVLASNPCPCGNGHGNGIDCTCSSLEFRRYQGRLSGPLLDRIDIRLSVSPVPRGAFAEERGESSAVVMARVEEARDVQRQRWSPRGHELNGRVPGSVLRRPPFRLPQQVTRAVDRYIDLGRISLRGYDRILRLAWTAADLAGHTVPDAGDVDFALALREAGAQAA